MNQKQNTKNFIAWMKNQGYIKNLNGSWYKNNLLVSASALYDKMQEFKKRCENEALKLKMKDLDLEIQYKKYLNKVKLVESKMHPIQRKETKNAFMAGCGQTLHLMLHTIGDIKDEHRAVMHLEDLLQQSIIYWEKAVK
ncbi:MAG: hypothetical protein WA775_02945 [Psychroserpens sp.]|uniref:hypothetical protein n=1 Tax=Psychroserpens sp. TaxID=2020870 RepID=UPI003CBD67A3